jgi:cytochrome c-type biogenesis protein CcmH/NrfG
VSIAGLWCAQGNLDSAVKHLQQAVRGDPDNSDVVGLLKKVKLMETKKKEGKCTFALFEI